MKALTSFVLAAALSTGALAEDNNPQAALAQGVIRLAASMNEMALACGHMDAASVQAALAKQREAAVRDMKVAPAQFDSLYAGYKADFVRKWNSGSRAQQQQSCSQMSQMKPK